MIPKKNSYAERRAECSKVRLYGETTNACRHCMVQEGSSSTSENLSFSMNGSVVMSIRENK